MRASSFHREPFLGIKISSAEQELTASLHGTLSSPVSGEGVVIAVSQFGLCVTYILLP